MFNDILLRYNDQRMNKLDNNFFGHINDQKFTRRISQKKIKNTKKTMKNW
jgi:hypothetical protein